MRSVLVVGMLVLAACGRHAASEVDAPLEADAAEDDAVAVDAPDVDAPPGIDAPLSTASPACTTAPAVLVDVSPRQIATIAIAGSTLYVGAFRLDGANQVLDASVLAVDAMTGAQVATPLATTGAPNVWSAGDDVYATDGRAGGSIYKLHPGAAPVEVVVNRPRPTVVTSDGTYLYWGERAATAGAKDVVVRRLVAGGAVEPVTTCDGAQRLAIVGDQLYCASFFDGIVHAPLTGGAPTSVPTAEPMPVPSFVRDGNELFVVNLSNNPRLLHGPLPDGPLTILDQLPILGRYVGLALTADFFYTAEQDSGIRRIDRTTLARTLIPGTTFVSGDPLVWNGQLYFAASSLTTTTSGHPFVMHCVD